MQFTHWKFAAAVRRATWLVVCLVVLAAVVFAPSRLWSAAPAPKPNVVLILCDDLGWADLNCYGSTFHKTLHLDRLAAAGMRFTDAYAACPVCSPTRAALLTGMYPQRFQITDWLPGRPNRRDQRLHCTPSAQQLPLSAVTLAELVKQRGYATGHIGKWHLGGAGFGPREQGFDHNIAGDHTGTPRSYVAPFRNQDVGGREVFMPGLEQAAEGEYLTDRLTAEAEKFIDAHRAEPFFLYLPHYAVHTPLAAKKDRVAAYPQSGGLERQSNPVYAAMLESVDEGVGRIVKKLDDLKLSDNTLVIFTSDNGGLATLEGMKSPATINAPLREGKGYLYEGGIRVPLIVKWPHEVKAGGLSRTPVISQDLFATISEACGAEIAFKLDGVSLLAHLRGSQSALHDALYWHYPHYANQGSRPAGAMREGAFKLVEHYDPLRRELFDVCADVSESRNLAYDKPEVVARMAAKLDTWRKEVGAVMPTANRDYMPNPQAADGVVILAARTADVHGVMLRFEPLPHKNTLGYWVNQADYATFEFTISKPGEFTLEAWQGCGGGNGGSVVEFIVGEQTLAMTVEETGGFQNFRSRSVGKLNLPTAGRYTLTVKAKTKAKAAVMDLQQVVLKPAR